MAHSQFAFDVELDGENLIVDPVGLESHLDALIRALAEHNGKEVKACLPSRNVRGRRAYSILFSDGRHSVATLGNSATA